MPRHHLRNRAGSQAGRDGNEPPSPLKGAEVMEKEALCRPFQGLWEVWNLLSQGLTPLAKSAS